MVRSLSEKSASVHRERVAEMIVALAGIEDRSNLSRKYFNNVLSAKGVIMQCERPRLDVDRIIHSKTQLIQICSFRRVLTDYCHLQFVVLKIDILHHPLACR